MARFGLVSLANGIDKLALELNRIFLQVDLFQAQKRRIGTVRALRMRR